MYDDEGNIIEEVMSEDNAVDEENETSLAFKSVKTKIRKKPPTDKTKKKK